MKYHIYLYFILPLISCAGFTQAIDLNQRPYNAERSNDYDALHYRIELSIDLDQKYFSGENTITLKPLRNEFAICTLDVEELHVTEVLGSDSQYLEFIQTDTSLIVYLADTAYYGDELSFTVKYFGKDPEYGLHFIDQSPSNPLMAVAHSFPDRARHWFPCFDFPNDKVTQEIIVHASEKYKVLSNGILKEVISEKPGIKTWFWKQNQLHSTYLSMVAVGPFEVIRDSLDSLPVNHWIYPKDMAYARELLATTPNIIKFYSDLFDFPYPWVKYAHVTTPVIGGAAESTTATLLGQQLIFDPHAEEEYYMERIVAHEIAHHWWGDLITLRSWSQTWLNEGFATYSDYLYTVYKKGDEEGAIDLLGKKETYLNEAHNKYIRPIVFDRYEVPGQNFDHHTYQKAACVLHMLRQITGDDLFFRTLQYFLDKHAFKPVDTHDFMIAIKEVTGQNLDWFFEQFIYSPGHPVFNVSTSWNELNNNLTLNILQVQDTVGGVPSVFNLPVHIGIYTDTSYESHRVWLSERLEEFEFSLPGKPNLVRFDEGNFLLKEWTYDKDTKELIYQLTHDDMIGRAWAARELSGRRDHPQVTESLKKVALSNTSWYVRREALQSLYNIGGNEFSELYMKLADDPHSRVRERAFRLMATKKDQKLLSFYREKFSQDDSYLVKVAIIESIGISGDRLQIPFLENAAAMESPRNEIMKAAENAIQAITE
jgi:aminopeptidase N